MKRNWKQVVKPFITLCHHARSNWGLEMQGALPSFPSPYTLSPSCPLPLSNAVVSSVRLSYRSEGAWAEHLLENYLMINVKGPNPQLPICSNCIHLHNYCRHFRHATRSNIKEKLHNTDVQSREDNYIHM